MLVPGSANPLLLKSAAAAAGGYQISRSLRFNASDSAYLSRTPASAGSQTTWTISTWIKRSTLGTTQRVFSTSNSSNTQGFYCEFTSSDVISFYDYNNPTINWQKTTTQVFRDTSAWYHFVIVFDSTQGTASNRFKFYVNGTQVTTFSTSTDPSPSFASYWNAARVHAIGRTGDANASYFDGYLANIHFIDGQALDPSSFTETDATTGQLIPKTYTGSYGTNGFNLLFADNSSNTASTLGKDTSGLSNNWTPNNLSVTAGAGNDSLVDVPTNGTASSGADPGGSTRGNYCTLNPLATSAGTLSNGNLEYIGPSAWSASPSTILLPSTGKFYTEATLKASPINSAFSGLYAMVGVIAPSAVSSFNYNSGTSFFVSDTGHYSNYSSGSSGTIGTFTAGTVIGLAIDRDTNQVTVYQDGVSKVTITLGITSGAGLFVFIGSYDGNYGQMAINFGQRSFAYTAPSGFKALCTTNLPAPLVTKPSTVFDTKLWTGNGSSQTISGLGFSPDLVWVKARSSAYWHNLVDTVRGYNKYLFSNATDAEGTETNRLTSFNSDGFSLGSYGDLNGSGVSVAGWCWDAGSSTVTNTQGSITSTVRANATAGVSVISYVGTGSAGASIGHGLGVAPAFALFKNRSVSSDWQVYHVSLGNAQSILLQSTAAAVGSSAFNSTSPTSTIITLGAGRSLNNNGSNHICYAFAPVVGYSSFGNYIGNGSADGPFVYTGFRPRFLLVKSSSFVEYWEMYDSARDTYNAAKAELFANTFAAEGSYAAFDFLSNGFKMRGTGTGANSSGQTYIYCAFAESPFQFSRAR